MSGPLTDAQIDAIWNVHEDAPTVGYRYAVTRAILAAGAQQAPPADPIHENCDSLGCEKLWNPAGASAGEATSAQALRAAPPFTSAELRRCADRWEPSARASAAVLRIMADWLDEAHPRVEAPRAEWVWQTNDLEWITASLAASIRALRTRKGITQAELAKAIGRERTSVTNMETGRQLFTLDTLTAIAKALDVELVIQFGVAVRGPAEQMDSPEAR